MGSSSDRKARGASTNEGDTVDDNAVKSSAPVDRLRLPEKDKKKDRKKDKLTEIPDKQKKTAMHINTDDTLDKKDSSDVEHTIHRAHAEDPDDDAAAPASVISTVDDTLPAATCVSAQRQQPQAKVKAGLPRWIAQPTLIPANLADTAYTRALDDHRLQLSAAMLERCRAFGMERLFPVQVAVVDALAGGQAQRGDVVQTKAVSKKRKKDHCATSTAVDPWERQFLYAVGRGDVVFCIVAYF